MKAFKGCINEECKAFKKIKYKKDDYFCSKCGTPLVYVCADCWKQMDDDNESLCLNCKAKRAQKKEEQVAAVKGAAQDIVEVVGAVGAAGGAVAGVAAKVVPGVAKVAQKAKFIKK